MQNTAASKLLFIPTLMHDIHLSTSRTIPILILDVGAADTVPNCT